MISFLNNFRRSKIFVSSNIFLFVLGRSRKRTQANPRSNWFEEGAWSASVCSCRLLWSWKWVSASSIMTSVIEFYQICSIVECHRWSTASITTAFLYGLEATNAVIDHKVIKPTNVIQIDHKCNKTGKCYPNRIYSKERCPQYKTDKNKRRGAPSNNTISYCN